MALQFDPGAYGSIYEQTQNRQAQQDQQRNQLLSQSINAIPQALIGYQQNQQAQANNIRKQKMDQLLLGLKASEQGYDPNNFVSSIGGSPQTPQQTPSPQPGPWSNAEPQGMPAASTGGMYSTPPSSAMSPIVAAHKQMLASNNPFEKVPVDYGKTINSMANGDYSSYQNLPMSQQKLLQEDPRFKNMAKPGDVLSYGQAKLVVPTLDQNAFSQAYPNGIPREHLAMMSKPKEGISGEETYTTVATDANGNFIQIGNKSGRRRVVSNGGAPSYPVHSTDAQSTAAGYGDRAASSHQIIDNLFNGQLDPRGLGFAAQESRITPNIAKSGNVQSFDQAKRNFLNAILRRESGAVISPSEFEEGNKQYFPVYGDTPETLKQKAANREQQIANLARSAGPMASRQPQGGGLMYQGRPLKDTPANRAWLAQQGGQQ